MKKKILAWLLTLVMAGQVLMPVTVAAGSDEGASEIIEENAVAEDGALDQEEENTEVSEEIQSYLKNDEEIFEGEMDSVGETEISEREEMEETSIALWSIPQSEFETKLNSLRVQYPNYSTWNDWFDGGHQCFGFARLIGYNVFGSKPSTWSQDSNFDHVKAGDLIQYGNTSGQRHTVFVTGVSGNTITFVDCNGNGNYSGGTKVRSNGVKLLLTS